MQIKSFVPQTLHRNPSTQRYFIGKRIQPHNGSHRCPIHLANADFLDTLPGIMVHEHKEADGRDHQTYQGEAQAHPPQLFFLSIHGLTFIGHIRILENGNTPVAFFVEFLIEW